MEKTKLRVNAKAFVEDYRSGKSADDLMKTHGLSEAGLGKLVKVLVNKGLLEQADVGAGESLPPAAGRYAATPDPSESASASELQPQEPAEEPSDGEDSLCPQCRARVSVKALICPECGHVLPGEERWSSVEPAKSITERIPPKVLGIFIALPLALLLFFLFRDIFIPAAEDSIERRSDDLRKKIPRHKGAIKAAVAEPVDEPIEVLQEEVNRLIASDILSSADEGYRRLVVGSAWFGLGPDEKELHLLRIRAVMIRCGVEAEFEVVDFWGRQVAHVSAGSVDITLKEEFPESEGTREEPEVPPKQPPLLEGVPSGAVESGPHDKGPPQ